MSLERWQLIETLVDGALAVPAGAPRANILVTKDGMLTLPHAAKSDRSIGQEVFLHAAAIKPCLPR